MLHVLGPISTFIVVTLGGGIVAVYLATVVVLVSAMRRRLRLRGRSARMLGAQSSIEPGGDAANRRAVLRGRVRRHRLRSVLRGVVLVLAAAQTACLAYAGWVEPGWLEITHVTITSPKLPAGETIRLMHISDLHCEAYEQLEPRLIAAAREHKPDLIAFTGDCANSAAGVERFKGVLRALTPIAPVYVVQGNWDVEQLAGIDKFGGTGAIELTGQPIRFHKRAAVIVFQGLAVDHEKELPDALARLGGDDFNILLYHYPDRALIVSGSAVDLFLAGHTHGGQVALPWYGAITTLSRTGKLFERGLYVIGSGGVRRGQAGGDSPASGLGMRLYINRGLGMDGAPLPRMRFFARPEITLIELSR